MGILYVSVINGNKNWNLYSRKLITLVILSRSKFQGVNNLCYVFSQDMQEPMKFEVIDIKHMWLMFELGANVIVLVFISQNKVKIWIVLSLTHTHNYCVASVYIYYTTGWKDV